MKATEVIELLYKAMPYSNQICNLDIKGDNVYFTWRGNNYVIENHLSVSECENDCLVGSNNAILIEHILKTYKNK